MSSVKHTWKDTSSYSKSDKERIPKCFEVEFGHFKLVVHRHIHYPQDVWLASCHPELFRHRELKSKDLAEAQCQAVAMLQVELENALREITNKKET